MDRGDCTLLRIFDPRLCLSNTCLKMGRFSNLWKRRQIILIAKEDRKKLCKIAKLFERVAMRLSHHLMRKS